MPMMIAVPRERFPGERRVALTPEVVGHLLKLGFEVSVEAGAGELAAFSDDAYRAAGARIVENAPSLYADAHIVVKVRAPSIAPVGDEVELLREGSTLISFIWPAQNEALLTRLSARNVTVLAMDCVPRISRAQKLDALSSMANMAGYRAVIEAAHQFGRGFMGQITAAGKIAPAKVMVIGAGVAGLAAIGAARSLGAIVRAFDTRPEVRQQVESMGAEFLELDYVEDGSGSGGYAKEMSAEFIAAEMALFAAQAKDVDVIVTTALIPGKPAPKLITADMVRSMRQGSVIVDMAAEQGGNCELTRPGEAASIEGVTIVGYTDLPSRMATQSSQLYGTNLRHLLTDLTPQKNGEITLDTDDEVMRGVTVVLRGEVKWPPPKKPEPAIAPPAAAKPAATIAVTIEQKRRAGWIGVAGLVIAAALLAALGAVAPPAFVAHFTVFVLAIFVGFQVVWNVTPALHTPLMSVTNAVSGIIVTGALLQVGTPHHLVAILAGLAILVATINIAGGFLVTQRMLNMFQR
ncbi:MULTISPECIES: Re/Si-specific NAD(P)(+) transhydrogenase subunit alpha [Caballeronia]|uniref:Re/Si-specific NAD(P)(+) transhydrogenase subunit alpha n=1 Tax=Caballeronia TaxID=1827195 RepID=UPI00158D7CD6|nr:MULTISPECIES: Re/Si-specific NAD(P)(+) transhydrogenase subunit alpha [Caballeronia]MCG7403857.1 Re/Si-specific NAD(P)(+) transhydrogenase subunit alpha [Caballeronia zhejiangensis]MCI1044679.1 Re/Si-specific NAD(P)(+) transhydrogenase subunit alpha [Caballeronia zhejiangensis]